MSAYLRCGVRDVDRAVAELNGYDPERVFVTVSLNRDDYIAFNDPGEAEMVAAGCAEAARLLREHRAEKRQEIPPEPVPEQHERLRLHSYRNRGGRSVQQGRMSAPGHPEDEHGKLFGQLSPERKFKPYVWRDPARAQCICGPDGTGEDINVRPDCPVHGTP